MRQAAVVQIQKQQAIQQLQNMVEQLNDITYNQPNALAPAAQKLGLTLQTTDWVPQNTKQGLFANPKLQTAAFTNDVIQGHHNSEVVDMGDGSYVVVRSTEYQASRVQPLAEVQAQIVTNLKAQQASQMASAMGQQQLAQLQQGKLKLNFTNPENVSLLGQSKDVDPMAVKQIFAVSSAQFPAYTGTVNQAGDYIIYQINSQKVDNALDAQNQKVVTQLAEQYSMMTLNAYVASLRSDYKVSYKLDRIQNQADGSGSNAPQSQGN
jgi:peptidyl-prolyl cis-trans isomerase D